MYTDVPKAYIKAYFVTYEGQRKPKALYMTFENPVFFRFKRTFFGGVPRLPILKKSGLERKKRGFSAILEGVFEVYFFQQQK